MSDSILRELAAVLRDAGYATALRERLHLTYPDDIGLLNHAPAMERVAADKSAAGSLIRLFYLEAVEPLMAARRALTQPQIDRLVAAALLRVDGRGLTARLRVDAVGDHYVMADLRFRSNDRRALKLPGSDPVYPPGSDSMMLREIIPTDAATAVLDLCTGTGVQGLACAGTAARVVAVDINPRAAAMARLNAYMNGIDNLEVRAGDLYAAVRLERFDLVLANPPFVSSPYQSGPAYHAGGATGDRILRRIIKGLPSHLLAGGRFFAVSHVGMRRGEELPEVARRWFAGFRGRALVLTVEQGTPVDLAAAQALFALRQGLKAYAAEVRLWVSYLQRHRIATIVALLIAAENTDQSTVEVIDAQPRVLPLPLTPTPAMRVKEWLARR